MTICRVTTLPRFKTSEGLTSALGDHHSRSVSHWGLCGAVGALESVCAVGLAFHLLHWDHASGCDRGYASGSACERGQFSCPTPGPRASSLFVCAGYKRVRGPSVICFQPQIFGARRVQKSSFADRETANRYKLLVVLCHCPSAG